jgi:ribosomal protein S18 acetylase RimI-like enzyme
MICEIEKVDHENATVRKKIFSYLAEVEPHTLFILGNLTMNFPQTHLYAASRNGRWVGIAGYYATHKAIVPFSTDADVTRALTRHVVGTHKRIEYMNGIAYAGEPAYAELLQMGYQPANNPYHVFMEMSGLPPRQPHEASARLMQQNDRPEIAHLLRCLSETWDENRLLTTEELERTGLNPLRTVVSANGQIVSTASSNGLGIRCYQILGVATHPARRRHGYARAAVAAIMRIMAGLGGRHAVLFADRENTAAQQCYLGMGFKITGEYYVAKLKNGKL